MAAILPFASFNAKRQGQLISEDMVDYYTQKTIEG